MWQLTLCGVVACALPLVPSENLAHRLPPSLTLQARLRAWRLSLSPCPATSSRRAWTCTPRTAPWVAPLARSAPPRPSSRRGGSWWRPAAGRTRCLWVWRRACCRWEAVVLWGMPCIVLAGGAEERAGQLAGMAGRCLLACSGSCPEPAVTAPSLPHNQPPAHPLHPSPSRFDLPLVLISLLCCRRCPAPWSTGWLWRALAA